MAVKEKFRFDPDTGEFVKVQDQRGHEIPDSRPMEVPSGFKKPELLADTVRRLVRSEQFNQEMERAGYETFDDADDFDVDEELDLSTPYETFFDPVLGKDITPMEFRNREAHYREQYLQATRTYFDKVDREEILRDNLRRAAYRQKKAGGEGGAPPSDSSQGPSAAPTPSKS